MGQDQLIFPRKLFSLSGRYPNQKRGKSLATGISTGTYFLNSTYNESRINSARLQIAEKYKLFITGGEDVYIKNIISGSVPNTPVQDTGVCKMIFHTPFHFSNFRQKLTPEWNLTRIVARSTWITKGGCCVLVPHFIEQFQNRKH